MCRSRTAALISGWAAQRQVLMGGPSPLYCRKGRSDTLSIPGGVLFLSCRGRVEVDEFVSIGLEFLANLLVRSKLHLHTITRVHNNVVLRGTDNISWSVSGYFSYPV